MSKLVPRAGICCCLPCLTVRHRAVLCCAVLCHGWVQAMDYSYGDVTVRIQEGMLGDGLGARVWTVAHVMCRCGAGELSLAGWLCRRWA